MGDYTMTCSAELMRNFLQDDILAAEAKFQALQAQDGSSLLFSIGTDDVFYATRELPQTRSGWARSDLSSALIAQDFPGAEDVRCANFATAQCTAGAKALMHLGMVVADGHNDHLYLSLANSDADTEWADAPAWTSYPFDDSAHKLSQLKIVDVFISEASDQEYIVVDILRDPSSAQPLVYRYYIDAARTGGYAWHPHDVSADVEAGGYISCLGRKAGQAIDGLYTAGHIGGSPQLMYQPLYNLYGSSPPSPSRFKLPGGGTPDCIAACRKSDNSSDLYVVCGTGLYYLSGHSQADGATAVALLDNPMLAGVRALFAAAAGSGVIVWGLNAANQIFSLTCTTSNPATGQWSRPLPIVTGAEQVSPYLDRASDASTFFCHTGVGKLTKAVKSPGTTMWTFREITLAPLQKTSPARNFSSYTTLVRVTGDADGQPVPGLPVTIQASNVTRVYINYLYYVVGPVAVTVLTDNDGSITVIEPVTGLSGTQLTVAAGNAQISVNPMDKAFGKAASLATPDLLATAVITNPDGSTQPLVAPGTSQADLQAAADGNSQLSQAYDQQQELRSGRTDRLQVSQRDIARHDHKRQPAARPNERRAAAEPLPLQLPGGVVSWLVEAGDLISSLAHQAASIVQVIRDEEAGVWNLVAQIAGEYYHCVLDTVESIVAGIEQIISMIAEYIEDVIRFLEFLFEWADITRTKQVLANIMKVSLDYELGQIASARAQFDQELAGVEQVIAGWAGLSDWSGLGSDAQSTPDSMSSSAPDQTASSSLVAHHYQNNAQNTTQLSPGPPVAAGSPLDPAAQVIEREGDTLYLAMSQLLSLCGDLGSMPLQDILTGLVGILTETVLDSAGNVADAMLGVMSDLGADVAGLLETPVHIPVVSDILNFFGVPDFSFLDVICWLAAVPATLLYKVATSTAPFPDDAETAFLISAPDYPSLLSGFGAPQARMLTAGLPGSTAQDKTDAEKAVHFSGHVLSGICSFVGVCIAAFEASEPPGNPFSKWSAFFGVMGAGSGGLASYVTGKLVPVEPIQNHGMSVWSDVLLGLRVWIKFRDACVDTMTGGWSTTCTIGPLRVADARGFNALFDFVLAIIGLIAPIYHFHELSEAPSGTSRTIAVLDELSNVTAIMTRICYSFAVNIPDPESREAMIGLMTFSGTGTSFLQILEGSLIW